MITIGALTYIAFLPPSPVETTFPFLNFEWLTSPFTVLPIQMFNWISRTRSEFHDLAPEPELLLLGEPTASLAPAKIEDLITQLGKEVTILIVTHNMQQAARNSDFTAFMHLGGLVEHNDTQTMFTNPRQERTESCITGRFG